MRSKLLARRWRPVLALGGSLILVACDSGSGLDAGSDDAGGCDGSCGTDLATYCQSSACPSSPSEAVAGFCDGGASVKVYSGCGHTVVIAASGSASEQLYFDADGGLLVIYETLATSTCCVAGPAGFEPAGLQGCSLALPSCAALADGGDAGDGGD